MRKVLRAGRVTAITADKIEVTGGSQAVTGRPLYVDCTASGGVKVDPKTQVFDDDGVTLLMVRPFQPLFSAALIAHLEFGDYNDTIRRFATQVTNFHDTPAEFLDVQKQGFTNQYLWNQNKVLRNWIDASRLNAGTHLTAGLTREDTEKINTLKAIGAMTAKAVENIPKMLQSA